MGDKPCLYKPHADHIEFFECLFGANKKKIHHFTHIHAQQAFAKMGCKTWIKGNSFYIEADDNAGNIHTFSSHIPHGQSNRLYRPTNQYLQRFCLSLGVNLEVIKAVQ